MRAKKYPESYPSDAHKLLKLDRKCSKTKLERSYTKLRAWQLR